MLNPGVILQNRYQILQRIGGGGMGDVYLATDLRLGNPVVVKENRGGDPQLFYAEARILAALRHPNLPRVSDHFVEANNAQYLVMDYIAGQNLEQIVQTRGALREQDAHGWMYQVLEAVKYLHANRVIHRDIKPQNIIITPQGNAVLVDFGIAKVMQPGRVTASGARGVGSPGFAPLEQYTGGTDERSDVYALGATFYFALTGVEPPPAPNRANGVPLQPIRARNASVSPNTEQIIANAAAVVISQRYQTVDAMQRVLRAPAQPFVPTTPEQPFAPTTQVQPLSAPSLAPAVPVQRRTATWMWVVSSAGAILLIGLVLIGLYMWIFRPPPAPVPPTATMRAIPTLTAVPPTVVPPSAMPTIIVVTATSVPPTSVPTPTLTPSATPSPTLAPSPTLTPTRTPSLLQATPSPSPKEPREPDRPSDKPSDGGGVIKK